MFWRILKKDLKRKKTMNIILLLFVILCSMLAAASVNNIVAVTGGIEHFMGYHLPVIVLDGLHEYEFLTAGTGHPEGVGGDVAAGDLEFTESGFPPSREPYSSVAGAGLHPLELALGAAADGRQYQRDKD